MGQLAWGSGGREFFKGLKKGKWRAKELIQHSLERAHAQQPDTNAFYEIFSAPENIAEGDFAGVPYAVKDFILRKDSLCTAGSRMLQSFKAPYTATCVSRLETEGFHCIGRTSMDEFGMGSSNENSYWGSVKNPHDLSRSPGGSSGGSAAVVAAGVVPFALGTDTGGSIRQPAAFCGVTGLKPSYGRVSRFGVISFASSLDQVGVLALDAHTCGVVLEKMSGEDSRDATCSQQESFQFQDTASSFKGRRIAVPRFVYEHEMDKEVEDSFEKFIRFVQDEGGLVETVEMPPLDKALAVYYIICTSEASSNLSRYNGIHLGEVEGQQEGKLANFISSVRGKNFGEEVKRRILLGTFCLSAGYQDAYFRKAAQVRRLIKESYEKVFEEFDFVLSPTSFECAFPLGDRDESPLKMYQSDLCTIPASLAGLPAISFPSYQEGALPVGLQLVGPYFKEQNLLEVVQGFQEHKRGFRAQMAGGVLR